MEEYVTEKKPFWKSKKWMTAAIAALIPLANAIFGLDLNPSEVAAVIIPLVVYVYSQGKVDAEH